MFTCIKVLSPLVVNGGMYVWKGKIIPLNSAKIFYDDNETGKNNPNLVYEIERYHSNHENNECRAYKLLRIYLDENFTLNKHIDILQPAP
jgi:hypothetical protein